MSRTAFAAVLSGLAAACALSAFADEGKALEAGHEYLITTNYPNNVHVIDMQSDSLYKTCTLPGGYGPGTTQLSPDRKVVYVLTNHYADIYGVELDSCKTVFHASMAQKPGENARAMFSMTVSHDGKEIYAVANPTMKYSEHYEVQQPRLQVYAADAGMDAKPVRSYPAPRQLTIMQSGDDGSLYVAGSDIYKVDPKVGKFEVIVPSRNWKRPLYAQPDVLYVWDQQTYNRDFLLLYTTAKFKDEKQDPNTADALYGYFSVNLANGKSETTDFGPLTEIYFSAMRSPKDPNQIFGVLNRLAKYDVKEQKLLGAANLDHSYYCVNLNKAGNKVYLSGTLNDVAIFDADSLKPLGKIKLPGGDMAITTSQAFIR
ncbi:quinohemoprotein amine dehydrogenase subunit beta [Pseudomonas panipatensis]|uniref:Quinohemoprotein amine dehydrogenase, beta subunit n=1 Tax=Pseudomonas panipatensis TaxID=428992 RepID=A0A1G8L208_9PSED|nr:quinohemoprotein amine dehydrogenase subunit beta [Pseudomonas panipatensis]SDI49686.1 quinohemoprotein amine dehydrogenase, beta subunit [Pseudomonas panipatensis]SMP72727.1 quinohemoprotein amine dehydrogenase, beta subunit [Pseudomonas panipatensis]